MKSLMAAAIAATFALTSVSALASDAGQDTLRTDPPAGETRAAKTKDYVKKKAHNAKVRTKRAAKKARTKVSRTIANRQTTEPSSVSESKPDAAAK